MPEFASPMRRTILKFATRRMGKTLMANLYNACTVAEIGPL